MTPNPHPAVSGNGDRDDLLRRLNEVHFNPYTSEASLIREVTRDAFAEIERLRGLLKLSEGSEEREWQLSWGAEEIDRLTSTKRTCRELAGYIWERAHFLPTAFRQDIGRLIENERKSAAERAVKHSRPEGSGDGKMRDKVDK